jgi:predicted SprT family Zn-dependent metalloprotease
VHRDKDVSDMESRNFRLNLKYLGESRLELRGTSTGETYLFSSDLRIQPVDLRDAKFLLASPLFTIA